jgi:hypothetical protein
MQNNQRRYFGMTCIQVMILGCLGLLALGGVGYFAKLILGNEMPLAASPEQPSQEPQASLAPVETETPIPTNTPALPTPTFTATTYESLIPEGWNQFKYSKVEMWMPADFVKASSSLKDDVIYAENKNRKGNGFIVSVSLSKDTPTVTDLDDYIRDGLKHFTPETTFLEKRAFEVGSYEAERLKMQAIIMNTPIGEVIYFIKDGGTIWIITGLSEYNEFNDWLTTFDQIAHTFRANP